MQRAQVPLSVLLGLDGEEVILDSLTTIISFYFDFCCVCVFLKSVLFLKSLTRARMVSLGSHDICCRLTEGPLSPACGPRGDVCLFPSGAWGLSQLPPNQALVGKWTVE
jgi:hypothetical protein